MVHFRIEVKVPQLSESVAEATLVSWHKKAGEYVKRDENLVDIETDKVVLETPAPASGVLTRIIKGDGSTVVSKEVIATIDTDGKPQAASQRAAEPAAQPQATAKSSKVDEPSVMPAAQKTGAKTRNRYVGDQQAAAAAGASSRATCSRRCKRESRRPPRLL